MEGDVLDSRPRGVHTQTWKADDQFAKDIKINIRTVVKKNSKERKLFKNASNFWFSAIYNNGAVQVANQRDTEVIYYNGTRMWDFIIVERLGNKVILEKWLREI